MRFHDLLTSEDKERFERRFPIFQETGIANDVEYHWISKDGSVVPISVSGTAIRSTSGSFQKSVAVVVNLSQRKRAESSARRQALIQQRQDLISVIDQDIKVPLVTATGLLESLMRNNDGQSTPQQQAIFARLLQMNESMLERIGLMLDINHFEVKPEPPIGGPPLGSLAKVQEQMPLWKVIEGCVLAVSRTTDFISQELSFDLDLNAASIIVDANAFKSLLGHLLENATNHSPEHGRIKISCTRAPRYFELSVSDEGPGLAPALLEHVFERSSTDGASAAPQVGTGLIRCAEIAEQYGGNISCVNQIGSGAKFTIRIPMQNNG